MEYSLFEFLWFFVIYSMIGWCVEVAFHVVTSGRFINRGFLNGPVCPIYGFGMMLLLFTLRPLTANLFVLFIGSILLTTLLEFVTGYMLGKIFHKKWWDYSNRPFNIKGYVCLSFSIAWGLGAIFVLEIIHPPIEKLVSMVTNQMGLILLVVILIYFVVDFIITLLGILKIKSNNRLLNEIGAQLRFYAEGLGEDIYSGMTLAIQMKDNVKKELENSKQNLEITFEERKARFELLKQKYEKLRKEKSFVHKRIEKAFPRIQDKLSNLERRRKPKDHPNKK